FFMLGAEIYQNYNRQENQKYLALTATFLSDRIQETNISESREKLNQMASSIVIKSGTRISLISADGTVIFDSEKNPAEMVNHAFREEIKTAFDTGKSACSIRYSKTVKKEMMYFAVPIADATGQKIVVRASVPLISIDQAIKNHRNKLFLSLIFVAIPGLALIFWTSWKLSLPIVKMEKGVEKYSHGDFSSKFDPAGIEEIDRLAVVLNAMAENMRLYLQEITDSNFKMNTILSNMQEAVIALDMNEKIISLNDYAIKLFKVSGDWQQRKFYEVIRHPEMQKFCNELIQYKKHIERDIELYDKDTIFLQAKGSPLLDSEKKDIGVLIVLNDLTKIKRLENMRREFVANVSHEIRTPLTVIMASIETLRNEKNREGKHFDKLLKKIERHAERLNSLVDDILYLSKIEQNIEKSDIGKSYEDINEIVGRAIEACRQKADEKNITINFKCEKNIEANVNPGLLEQAVLNLIDNAIKYSDINTKINIELSKSKSGISISVKDNGIGIAEEHLPRIFERFYRVDKSRSRELGGTGLGLSIVKHIVNAHGGKIEVKSQLGVGSEFIITIPVCQEK
ncbi:MAG: ATP-binding protein, partial [Candidatus Nanoarchaeia archaeon]